MPRKDTSKQSKLKLTQHTTKSQDIRGEIDKLLKVRKEILIKTHQQQKIINNILSIKMQQIHAVTPNDSISNECTIQCYYTLAANPNEMNIMKMIKGQYAVQQLNPLTLHKNALNYAESNKNTLQDTLVISKDTNKSINRQNLATTHQQCQISNKQTINYTKKQLQMLQPELKTFIDVQQNGVTKAAQQRKSNHEQLSIATVQIYNSQQ